MFCAFIFGLHITLLNFSSEERKIINIIYLFFTHNSIFSCLLSNLNEITFHTLKES